MTKFQLSSEKLMTIKFKSYFNKLKIDMPPFYNNDGYITRFVKDVYKMSCDISLEQKIKLCELFFVKYDNDNDILKQIIFPMYKLHLKDGVLFSDDRYLIIQNTDIIICKKWVSPHLKKGKK